jgi:hypothetical protein
LQNRNPEKSIAFFAAWCPEGRRIFHQRQKGFAQSRKERKDSQRNQPNNFYTLVAINSAGLLRIGERKVVSGQMGNLSTLGLRIPTNRFRKLEMHIKCS